MRTTLIQVKLLLGVSVLTLIAVCAYHLSKPPIDQSISTDNGIASVGDRPNQSNKPPAPANLSELPGWHLFGVVEKEVTKLAPIPAPEVETPTLDDIPETKIPLGLTGIAYGNDAATAFAIIVTPDGVQRDYRAGDEIANEAVVHLIERRRVVIERAGKYESLSLPELSGRMPNPRNSRRNAIKNPNIRKKKLDNS